MSAQNIIKNSVLEAFNFNQAISLSTVIQIALALVASIVMGMLIYFVYKKFYQGVIFSRTFGITLVGMTLLTCMVTLAISTNIVISLGMVGALSIVRFRTAIKDPIDLLYLFWAISTGITVGANMYILALAAYAAMVFVMWFMYNKQQSAMAYVMVAHYTGDKVGDEIERALAQVPHRLKAKTIRGDVVELTLDVQVKHGNDVFAESVRNIDGVKDVTLIQYNGEYHG